MAPIWRENGMTENTAAKFFRERNLLSTMLYKNDDNAFEQYYKVARFWPY